MFHFFIKFKANVKSLFSEISLSFGKCFSKFNSYLAAFFFDDKELMNVGKELKHFGSINLPNILLLPIGVCFSTWGIHFIKSPSEVFIKPNNKAFIGARYIYSEIELTSSFGINITFPEHDASFAINNTSQISQFFPVIHEELVC